MFLLAFLLVSGPLTGIVGSPTEQEKNGLKIVVGQQRLSFCRGFVNYFVFCFSQSSPFAPFFFVNWWSFVIYKKFYCKFFAIHCFGVASVTVFSESFVSYCNISLMFILLLVFLNNGDK